MAGPLLFAFPLLLAAQAAPSGDEPHRPLADAPRFVAEARAFASELLAKVELVPGFGLAVVVDDQIILADGFGAADRERPLAADGDTLYYIASATKPFTALMASLLDARGEIELGDALADHLDEGQLDPGLGADRILLRDLLCHTSGLDNEPIPFRLAYTGEHDLDTLWRLIGRSTANSAGRGNFQYTNYGYNLLTLMLERDLGKRWQELLQDELFTPLGLDHTSATTSAPRAKGFTLAAPYRANGSGLERSALEKSDAQMQSAGGMVTSPRDAARWLSFQLNAGRLDGRVVVDPAIVRATQEPWTRIIGAAATNEGATACGGGWMFSEHAGRRLLQHGGGYPGFRATLSFLPEARVGVAVFVNSDFGPAVDVLRAWAYDWWLGRDVGDTAMRVAPLTAACATAREGIARTRAELAARTWQLTRGPEAYAGTYFDEGLGTLVIEASGTTLHARHGLLQCDATPYPQPDAIRLELIPGTGAVAQFELDTAGRATAFTMRGTRFVRRP